MIVGLLRPNGAHHDERRSTITTSRCTGARAWGSAISRRNRACFPRLTVRENVLARARDDEDDAAEREERLHQLLEDLNLSHLANRTGEQAVGR
jgi:ABC-type lipopolysaccharide export system ATPase subunit